MTRLYTDRTCLQHAPDGTPEGLVAADRLDGCGGGHPVCLVEFGGVLKVLGRFNDKVQGTPVSSEGHVFSRCHVMCCPVSPRVRQAIMLEPRMDVVNVP